MELNKENIPDSSLIEYCASLKQRCKLNKRVLFIQIPQFLLKSFNSEIVRKKGYYAFPPTGLQYLYEALKTRDLEIRILDLNFMILKKTFEDEDFNYAQWISMLRDEFELFKPSIVGISCMYDSNIKALLEILRFLKNRDDIVVITGGVIPTYEWKNLLKEQLCHFVIKGEGENKINYLFDYLTEENHDYKSLAGICYEYKGELFETNSKLDRVAVTTDLVDSYSLVNIEEYYKYGSLNPFSRMAGLDNSAFAAIQMSRGCRAICTFCSVRDFIGRGVRKRPVDKILREMGFLIENRGIRHFEWLDDDLLFFKEDFKTLLKEIIRRKWKITWSANNGLIATSIDDEIMRLMRDSGCIGFKIGIETGNQEMLKKIKKPVTIDIFRKVARIVNGYPEVFVGGNFMLGFPGEKFSQMLDSFKFYLELDLDWGAFTLCQAIRGATAFSEFQDYFDTQIESSGENVRNFIPTRESLKGELSTGGGIFKGLGVFKIDSDSVPEPEQIKEIWFTFNLVSNYINNKNLNPEGRVDKFIAWVEMAQVPYPTNAYMSLFLALAYLVKGNQLKSKDYYNKAVQCCKTDYWQERFTSFGLDTVLNNFPKDKKEALETIERLRNHGKINYYLSRSMP